MHSRIKEISPVVAAIVLLVLAGCRRQESGGTPVARVGHQTLTVEEIRKRLQTTDEPSPAQMQQFAHRWVADEILYQEALKDGLDRSADISDRLEDLRRQLAINAYLEKTVYALTPEQISDSAVRAFYESHTQGLMLTQEVALVSFALFHDRDAATSFRNSVLKGEEWNAALTKSGTAVVARVDSAYHTEASLQPPELWRVAVNAKSKDPSFPISTSQGYFVLAAWKLARPGQKADIQYVDREIRNRLTVEARQVRMDSLLTELRKRQSIQVFLTSTGPDSSAKAQSE